MILQRGFVQFAHGAKVPLHDHYVQLMVREGGFDAAQADALLTCLDCQVKQKIYEKSLGFLSASDYQRALRRQESNLTAFRQAIFLAQQEHMEGLRRDFAGLEAEIGQTRGRLEEERRQLASGLQLDLSLEGRRRAEVKADLDLVLAATDKHEAERMAELKTGMEQVALHAKATIAAFGTAALIGLLVYRGTT